MPFKQQNRPVYHGPPVDPIRVPGKFVVEFGRGNPPKLEFHSDAGEVTQRLVQLWNRGDTSAQARVTTWHDVIRYYQQRL